MIRKTREDKKRAWIDGLTAARRSVLEAVRSLPLECADVNFIGTWSVMDLLAHMVGWDYTNIGAIQEILAGQYPSFFRRYDKDWQSYNSELVERYRKETLGESLAELESSHHQLVSFLQRLDAEALVNGKARSERGRTVTIRNLLLSEAGDETEHAKQVLAFREH